MKKGRLVTCDVVACIHNWSYPDLRANNYDSGRGGSERGGDMRCVWYR